MGFESWVSHFRDIYIFIHIWRWATTWGLYIYIWLSEKCGHLSSESTHFCGTQLVNPGWINPDYLAKTPTKMPTESVVSWVTRPGKLTVANLKMAIEIEDEYPVNSMVDLSSSFCGCLPGRVTATVHLRLTQLRSPSSSQTLKTDGPHGGRPETNVPCAIESSLITNKTLGKNYRSSYSGLVCSRFSS